MALSPNYGWSEPDNSSLVKNGAADIRTLGDAIDTSVWNVGYGQAGKNKIINGDFGVWQRGTSFNFSATSGYTADRWSLTWNGSGATRTISRQSFTPGTAPVAGYEGLFFYRYDQSVAGTGGTGNFLQQPIEDVRTLAGQTVTVSFWAKADASRSLPIAYEQNFGSGGSGTVSASIGTASLTTSWTRFTYTFSLPSISGKTIGANSYLNLLFTIPANTVQTIDIWGLQVEYGSKATPFQTATGTIQGELAACQRYYYRSATGAGRYGVGFTKTTTTAEVITSFPNTMRAAPSALEQSGTAADYSVVHQNTSTALSAVPAFNNANVNMASTNLTVASGLTAGNGCALSAASGNSYLAWSAEL